MPKLISLIIPVYNEAKNLEPLYQEIDRVWEEKLATNYRLEILFVDDGSKDESAVIISRLAQKDNRVKLIQFSRNFGKEAATSAGLHHAQGDVAIIMDADLQHPPELISKFIKKWQNGAEVVIGNYTRQTQQPFYRRASTNLYYQTMRLIGEKNIDLNSSDFRLLDRRVIEAFKKLPERNRITRGLIDWLGFKRKVINLEPAPRQHGKTSYDFKQLAGFTLSGLISHSLFPLKLSLFLGAFIGFFSGVIGIVGFIDRYLEIGPNLGISNLGFLALLLTFLVGVVLINLGLIALYIVNIQNETLNRPLYVIKKHTLDDE